MEFHIIGLQKKEYHNFPTKYYLHTIEYPHIIQVDMHIYNELLENKKDSLNFPYLKVSDYHGNFYYKYDVFEGKEE